MNESEWNRKLRCPRPTKQGFRSEREAYRAMTSSHHDARGMRVYRCRCGWWHFGHVSSGQ